jgi:glycogen synthase
MKIVHFVRHSFPQKPDGYSLRTRAIVRAQQKLGNEPVVVTSPEFAQERNYHMVDREMVDGVPHYHFSSNEPVVFRAGKNIPLVRRYLRHRRGARFYQTIARRCMPCDLFQVHMQPETVGQLRAMRSRVRPPIVYEVRGVWEDSLVACGQLTANSKAYRDAYRASTQAAREADWVVTISEGLRTDFVNRGISPEKISVVPNGVETSAFVPVARDTRLAEAFGLAGKTVLGYISSIRELEGIEYLIRAMPMVLEAEPKCACVIVGDGDGRPRLESLVRELGLQRSVLFTGSVPHAEITSYYSIIDVFVVPRPDRRVNQLVTPLKPLEAMAMARPLLVSRVGGLTEIVQEGRTGLVFGPEDPDDLARQAILVVRNPDLRLRLGEQARRFVVAERDWSAVVQRYEEVAVRVAGRSICAGDLVEPES